MPNLDFSLQELLFGLVSLLCAYSEPALQLFDLVCVPRLNVLKAENSLVLLVHLLGLILDEKLKVILVVKDLLEVLLQ